MNCLSRSNEGRRDFQFATEIFKRRPVLWIGIIFLIKNLFSPT